MALAELIERLSVAVTDEAARLAILAAADRLWPGQPRPNTLDTEAWSAALDILSGHPAGWIGVGVLMAPAKCGWTVHTAHPHHKKTDAGPIARVFKGREMRPWSHAKRPDCALVCASLKARTP